MTGSVASNLSSYFLRVLTDCHELAMIAAHRASQAAPTMTSVLTRIDTQPTE
jgi:hypothetical protein